MDLYTYYRSTSSYRVRIALALKQLDYRQLPVNLIGNGGEHLQPAYRALNPQGRVPALVTDSDDIITQSPAIIEFLEEQYPNPALLPEDKVERAKRRAVAALIGCDIQPLHNMAVLNQLRALNMSEEQISQWLAKWIGEGLFAVEQLIEDQGFCFGEPGLADVYLLPQLYAARRFNVDLTALPRILRVEALAQTHPAFVAAHPDAQADKPQPV